MYKKYSTYKLKERPDPLEKYIKNQVIRKAIWLYIYIFFIALFFSWLIVLTIYYSLIKGGQQAKHTDPLAIIWYVIGIFMLISGLIYQDNNLDKKEYLKLCKQLGVKIAKKRGRIILGHIDNEGIKTAAFIEPFFFTYLFGPFLGYVNPQIITRTAYPDYMNHTSQVNLFYLFSTSYKINFELKSNSLTKPEITTECPEINEVISNFIKDLDYFHWRIIFNEKWLRLVIIGGSWQGEIFARNIENGINVFKELINKMQDRYPVRDWKDYRIRYDKKTWEFYLEKA